MSILLNQSSKVIVQGITGAQGLFHAAQCLEYGTRIVGGVTPGKGGQTVVDGKIPVFNSCQEAVDKTGADTSLIFVQAAFAPDAIIEAADAGISLIVCITEGIPVKDMIAAKAYVTARGARLIGPNCPGLMTPGQAKVGIMPGFIAKSGSIGVISKSGTLTYEAIYQLCQAGLGQSTCIGIGGDPIIGSSMVELLALFEQDPDTEGVVIIGEIGGAMEVEAAQFVQASMTKPVVGFIAGQTAPPGRRMGHAGAVISGAEDTALAKFKRMADLGVVMVESPALIGQTMAQVLNRS